MLDFQMHAAFESALLDELRNSGIDVWEHVAQMIQEDFRTTIGKKLLYFKANDKP